MKRVFFIFAALVFALGIHADTTLKMSDFTPDTSPLSTDYLPGYRSAGVEGGNRRWSMATLSTYFNSQVTWSSLSGKPTLSTVATSGLYSDLSGKPSLSTVATSGLYSDLSGLPTLGTAAPLNVPTSGNATTSQVVLGTDTRLSDARTPLTHTHIATDISDSTSVGRGLLKAADAATQRTLLGLSTVASSGAYADLSGTPTIPTAANPSGTIGLSVNNGTATTFMRSDAHQAIDATVVPTWSGKHTFTGGVQANQIGIGAAADSAHNIYSAVTVIPTSPTGAVFTPHEFNITGAWTAENSIWAVLGRNINSGSNSGGTNGHGGGVVGWASDTSSGLITQYGVEARVDGAGTAGAYGGAFLYATVRRDSFANSSVGGFVRSEIYQTDGVTPGTTGTNYGILINPLVGGAAKFGFFSSDPVFVKNARVYSSDSSQAKTISIYQDGSDAWLESNSGNLRLNPGTGALVVQSGAAFVAQSGTTTLGLSGFRWGYMYGTTGDFSGPLFSSVTTLTYASPTSVTPATGNVFKTTTVNATGNVTFNAATAGSAGQEVRVVITNDATSAKTITFGTNFKPSGTLVGTISKTAVVTFVSDGTSLFEASRVTGL